MRIPLERRIAEAYSEGIPLVEAAPEYRERFLELWKDIASTIPDPGPATSESTW